VVQPPGKRAKVIRVRIVIFRGTTQPTKTTLKHPKMGKITKLVGDPDPPESTPPDTPPATRGWGGLSPTKKVTT